MWCVQEVPDGRLTGGRLSAGGCPLGFAQGAKQGECIGALARTLYMSRLVMWLHFESVPTLQNTVSTHPPRSTGRESVQDCEGSRLRRHFDRTLCSMGWALMTGAAVPAQTAGRPGCGRPGSRWRASRARRAARRPVRPPAVPARPALAARASGTGAGRRHAFVGPV